MLLLIGGSMAIKDVAYVAAEFLVSRKRGILASACDIMGDIATLLTIGYGGYEVIHNGFGITTLLVILAIAVGSLIGTMLGVHAGTFLMDHFPSDEPSLEDRLAALEHAAPHIVKRGPYSTERPTPEEFAEMRRKDAENRTLFDRQRCDHCGGLHEFACPRVKSIARTDAGVTYEYFDWGTWPTIGIIWPDEVYTEDE